MKKVFAFDLGRVIFDFDYTIALDKCIGRMSLTPEQVLHGLFYEEFGADYERGFLSNFEFYEKMRSWSGLEMGYDEYALAWSDIFSLNRGTEALIHLLKNEGYPVHMISNICDLHYTFLFDRYPDVFGLFDSLILSYQVGAIKPERKIFDELVGRAGVGPESIIYIDDRDDLIQAARPMGFTAIRFDSIDQCRADLRREGFPA
jgi:FMN phosphatase YigB (HAD superfamily)